MKHVRFTQMKDGTEEEFQFLHKVESQQTNNLHKRLMREIGFQAEESLPGYLITRLEHGLQSATRAYNDGADTEWVVAALLHDIGDGLAPVNHDRIAAEIFRPYMREETTWVVQHHGEFQMFYYGHHIGWDQMAREKYKDSPYYQTCIEFCERWDQSSFDPNFDSKPLDFFAPMVEEIFTRNAWDPSVIRAGEVVGLPEIG